MDAKERLRRYLEQRREMGERELMLDGMSIDDVLKTVGALGASQLKTAEKRRSDQWAEEQERRAAERAARAPQTGDAGPGPAPAPADEPEAPRRAMPVDFGGDWRAALTAAGAGAPGRSGAARPADSAGEELDEDDDLLDENGLPLDEEPADADDAAEGDDEMARAKAKRKRAEDVTESDPPATRDRRGWWPSASRSRPPTR